MGFTLRAALDCLPADAVVLVSELVPEVVTWNRGPLGELTRHPLDDPRVRAEVGDVGTILHSRRGRFDAVLLDVDNGPVAMTVASNARLYDREGLSAARASLKPNGVLAVWAATDDRHFERRLHAEGFTVHRERVRSRQKSGARHTILVAHNDRA